KTRARFENARHTVITTTGAIVAAEDRAGAAVLHEAGDEEIEFAVVVVIKPGSAGGPVRRGHAGFVGYVCESAVAVVVKENVGAVVRNVQILPAVAVVIRGSGAHAEVAHLPAR